jgi:hypothetical protein
VVGSESYLTSADTLRSISASARRAAPSLGIAAHDLQRYLLFDRFLARVFRGDPESFVLKGGMRMLAVVPMSRATADIDLESPLADLDSTVRRVSALAEQDMGDRLRFMLASRRDGGREDRPGLAVTRLRFQLAGTRGTVLRVDLAVHERTGIATVSAAPRFRVPLGKPVPVADYTMISVEHQIADKAAAMMERNHAGGDGRSSRAKDLLDLALIAMHLPCDARLLRAAVRQQIAERRLEPFVELDASPAIQAGFSRVAGGLAAFPLDWTAAQGLVNEMLRPALVADVDATWDPAGRRWVARG